jgi:hypothetical protein
MRRRWAGWTSQRPGCNAKRRILHRRSGPGAAGATRREPASPSWVTLGRGSVWTSVATPLADCVELKSARRRVSSNGRPPVRPGDRTTRMDLRRPEPFRRSIPLWQTRTASSRGCSTDKSGTPGSCLSERAFQIRSRTRGRHIRRLACVAPFRPSIVKQPAISPAISTATLTALSRRIEAPVKLRRVGDSTSGLPCTTSQVRTHPA